MVKLIIITLNLDRHACNFWPDQPSQPALVCLFVFFFFLDKITVMNLCCLGVCVLGWIVGPKVKGMHQSLAPQSAMNSTHLWLYIHLKLFRNLKWVLYLVIAASGSGFLTLYGAVYTGQFWTYPIQSDPNFGRW